MSDPRGYQFVAEADIYKLVEEVRQGRELIGASRAMIEELLSLVERFAPTGSLSDRARQLLRTIEAAGAAQATQKASKELK